MKCRQGYDWINIYKLNAIGAASLEGKGGILMVDDHVAREYFNFGIHALSRIPFPLLEDRLFRVNFSMLTVGLFSPI